MLFLTSLRVFDNISVVFKFYQFVGFTGGSESTCSVETQVQSLGWEDPLEEEMATDSSILA